MDLQLAGKNIVVTGGASGIGEATVKSLEAEGASVTVLDIKPPADGRPHIHCSLADPESIAAAVEQLPSAVFGLVNSAGVSGEQSGDDVMRINFLGLRELTELMYDRLEPGGAVVNVASDAGMFWQDRVALSVELIETPTFAAGVEWVKAHPLSGPDAYYFSKEAVVVYSQYRALRRFPTDRIRMNSISPGAISTPLLPSFYRSIDNDQLTVLRDASGGDGSPAEVASLITFLLSPRAGWVNGADINISGGSDGAAMTGALVLPGLEIPYLAKAGA
jgi:NAD(P)-dependent dehydrogenase (short-subunit alcohol dehydrogenase family)